MALQGWVKLHRSILEWEWHDDPNTFSVFIHLLLMASNRESEWHGQTIKAGDVVTSVAKLSAATGLTTKMTRTALNHLKQANTVAIKGANKFSVITLVNWGLYQAEGADTGKQTGKQTGNQGANKGQTKGNIVRIQELKESGEAVVVVRDDDHGSGDGRCTAEAKRAGLLRSEKDVQTVRSLEAENGTLRVLEAINRASLSARPTWKYIRSVLTRWKEQGYMDADGKEAGLCEKRRIADTIQRHGEENRAAILAEVNQRNERAAAERMHLDG